VAAGALAALLLPGAWPRVALRGLQAVLANSLFRSAYELLYTPLAPDRKRPVKALLDVGADRGGTIAGSAVVLLALLLPAAGTIPALLLLAALAAAVTLVLTRRLHAGYVAALADSLRTGAARLEGSEAPAPAAALAGRPLAATPRAEAEAWARSAADLRSREPSRVRAALARDRPLPADLVPLVLPLLRRDDLFTDAVAALREVGARCTGQLLDALLDPEEDPVVRRRVPRVLKAVPTQRAVDGLLLALEDGRFDVRYRSAQALVRLCLRGGPLSVPAEPLLAVARRELAGATPSARGLDHVAGLLALAFPGEPLHVAVRASRGGDASLRGTALEYLENVLPAALWSALWPWLGSRAQAAVSSGRTLDEVREDLLRSTRSWTLARRTGTRPLSRGRG
jgi:hypothetical protein